MATASQLADVGQQGLEIQKQSLTELQFSGSITAAWPQEIHAVPNHATCSSCATAVDFCDASRQWDGWLECFILWVKWRQPLGCSAVRAICEPVNKSSMGEPKPWSWGLSSHWLLCKARADENRGEEHQPRAMCRAERCTAPGPHAFSHWASTDLLPAGSEARALPSPWAVFEFQGCWVKFSFLFPNIIYAQISHLLMGFSQKLLTPSWVSKVLHKPCKNLPQWLAIGFGKYLH